MSCLFSLRFILAIDLISYRARGQQSVHGTADNERTAGDVKPVRDFAEDDEPRRAPDERLYRNK